MGRLTVNQIHDRQPMCPSGELPRQRGAGLPDRWRKYVTRLPSYLDRRQVLKLFGAVAAVGATGSAAACTASPMGMQMEQPSGRTIMIGLVAPALGPYAGIGNDIQRGFKLFVEDNDQLVGLHRVDRLTAEEGGLPGAATGAAAALIPHRALTH